MGHRLVRMRALKTSGAAPRERPQASFLQGLEGVGHGELGQVGQVGDLHRGEGLEVHVGPELPDAPEHVQIIGKGQIRVQAAHNVDFRHRLVQTLAHLVQNFGQRHGVGLGVVRGFTERAELAAVDADVGIVYVLVINVIGLAAVEALPHQVGQIPHPEEVPAAIQGHPVLPGEPLLGRDLVVNRH